jgi:hypothetical protein
MASDNNQKNAPTNKGKKSNITFFLLVIFGIAISIAAYQIWKPPNLQTPILLRNTPNWTSLNEIEKKRWSDSIKFSFNNAKDVPGKQIRHLSESMFDILT